MNTITYFWRYGDSLWKVASANFDATKYATTDTFQIAIRKSNPQIYPDGYTWYTLPVNYAINLPI